MELRPNISLVDVIKKGAFGGRYFKDSYSRVNNKFYKNSWKEFEELESINKKYYCSDFYNVGLNYHGVEVGTSLRFWEGKAWINKIDLYGWFQWYFRYWKGRSKDDKRQVNRWERIVSRFIGILKNKDRKKIRQILLHWCYEIK